MLLTSILYPVFVKKSTFPPRFQNFVFLYADYSQFPVEIVTNLVYDKDKYFD